MIAGGFQNERPADENVQNVINQVRHHVEQQIGNVGEFKAVTYISQVVAGMNYKVKVLLQGNDYIHLHIYVPLPYTQQPPTLNSIQERKGLNDPIN